jgi:cell wall assembly regulator SMI1
VDVSVASKYVADLTQFTHVVAEDMCNMVDSFKQDMDSNLPRQVRALLQHIHGVAQGKRLEGSPNTFSLRGSLTHLARGVHLVKGIWEHLPMCANPMRG